MANTLTERATSAPGRPAGAPDWLTGVRLRPGGAVDLIAWTASGVVVEGDARIVPAARVAVILDGARAPRALSGEVWSVCITSMARDGRLRYRAAIRFESPGARRHLDP